MTRVDGMGAGVLVGAGVPSRFEVTAESGPSDPAAAARLLVPRARREVTRRAPRRFELAPVGS